MIEATIPVRNEVGLHARPAALFVKTAAKFSSTIKVKNLTTNGNFVDAKSIIMVLTLGVMKDHEVVIQSEGADADAALDALRALIENNFGEA
ncbi:MAG TPA: HPr family phosphocarrier protein [Anaerolineales bacterium]|jgi:phosphocarrier protein FPr|nr:HPr family phosphocarrier protein [Anaerolineales bacterium]HRK89640.1 HPr family phosphocarrier protein [Anaerolineales bacterium]